MPDVLNKILDPDSTGDNKFELKGSVDLSESSYTPPAYGDIVKTLLATVLLADINAGKVLIPAVAGKIITPLDVKMTVSGNFAAGTSVELEDTNGTPVVVASVAQAGLSDGDVINETEANTTMGAGYLAPLTTGKGLALTKTGSDFTGGTSITVRVLYKVV